MIEGNPESPQSIVYDHSEKKLGSELITASLDTGSGITSSSYITYDGKMNINAAGQDFYIQINNNADTSSEGFRYRLVVTVDSYTSGSMTMAGGSAGFVPFAISNSFNDIIVPDSNGGSFQFRVQNYVAVISSISLKKIEMGNHATTNFFGDELIDSNARTFEGTSTYGWAVYGNNTITNDSNTLKITRVDNNQGAYLYLRDATDLTTNLTVGTTYLLKGDFLTTDASKTFTVRISNTGGTDIAYNNLNNTSFVTKEFEFVAAHATNAFIVVENLATDGVVKVDNLTLKEVGISSSGFDTAVNEPVVPQVPLMRYNQKMYFDGVDDKLNPSAPDLLVSSDWSISAWFVTDSISADQFIMAQTQSANNRIGIHINTSGNIVATMWDGSSYYQKSSTAISVGTMNHVVYANSNKTITLYLNGVAQSGGLSEGVESATGTTIGCKTGNSMFFNGIIEDMSFFNHTMTSTEAQELFNDGVALDATTHSQSANLIGYWRNDGVTTWEDRSTNSNDGTVSGSPDSITIREGLNTNRDGLGFYFTNSSSNVLRLNGIDEHLKLPYTKSFDMGDGSFTVSAWVKTTLGVGDTLQTILWARDNDDSNKGFEFQIDDGSDRPRFILSDGSATECLGTNNSVKSNKWHFVAVVVDKENDLAKIFLSESDGSALKCQTTIDISARGNINATPDWYIGKRKIILLKILWVL